MMIMMMMVVVVVVMIPAANATTFGHNLAHILHNTITLFCDDAAHIQDGQPCIMRRVSIMSQLYASS
jgi:hypothetical protein